MGGILAKLLGWLLGRLFGGSQPSQEAKASATAAAAGVSLSVEQTSNADVAKAVAAGRASDDKLVRQPDAIRAPDPDSRD